MERRGRLVVPPLLVQMINDGRWVQPDDTVIQQALPMLSGLPFQFFLNGAFAPGGLDHLLPANDVFWLYRGSESGPRPLPWLDVELAILIGINKNIGDDLGVALDYRVSATDPRVVASKWQTLNGLSSCQWVEAYPSFHDLARALQLL
jgi:hypothetical protein